VYFIGNVGEEGPGNLRGTRHLFTTELKGKIDYFISVDDSGLGIASRAVGSNRYRVTYTVPAATATAHSESLIQFTPRPSDCRHRGHSGSDHAEDDVQRRNHSGRTSVNSISGDGVMEVDMRSEDAASLATVNAKVQRILQDALTAENARWPVRGSSREALAQDRHDRYSSDRSAGRFSANRRHGDRRRKALGFTSTTSASSTDANIPISLGIPGIRIGGGGSNDGAHSLGEWYSDGPNGYLGPQWAALLVAALAGVPQVVP
jgi:acetylornithine deacetylase/succinyl-diaminopimelate desuccinylase-like protein